MAQALAAPLVVAGPVAQVQAALLAAGPVAQVLAALLVAVAVAVDPSLEPSCRALALLSVSRALLAHQALTR